MRCSVALLLLLTPRAAGASAASPVSLATEVRGLRGVHRRPIITGCLEECGTEDQSCVTQCQVCVEQNNCESLVQNCSPCLQEVSAARELFKAHGNVTVDSGGASLVHEGIRQHLNHARLKAIESWRVLRKARAGVMEAQRNTEWAQAERKQEVRLLKEAKSELEENKDEGKNWGHRKARGLEEAREDVKNLQKDANRTKRQLVRVRVRLEEAKRRVAEAKDFVSAGPHARVVVVVTKLKQRLEWKLREQQRAVDKEMATLRREEKDARWYQRGLKRQNSKMARELKRRVEALRSLRASEILSREQRRKAKNSYREAVSKAQKWASEVQELRAELAENPLQPPEPVRSPDAEPI